MSVKFVRKVVQMNNQMNNPLKWKNQKIER